jgi:hypothetical protein
MIKYVYDVAFNNNVEKIEKISFDRTIDVIFGIYEGMLSINLAPSSSNIDWKINLSFFMKKVKPSYAKETSKVKIHGGYIKEWEKYREQFFNIINSNERLNSAINNGLVVTGRSKGGGEASIIALDLVRNASIPFNKVFVGMLEAPKVGNKAYKKSVEKYIPIEHLYWVRYGADIVTMVPPFFKNPGKLIKFHKSILPFSITDHAIGCFAEERLYPYVEKFDNGVKFD